MTDFSFSIKELSRRIGAIFDVPESALTVEILQDVSGEYFAILQRRLVEIITENAPKHNLAFQVCDEKEYPDFFILKSKNSMEIYRLVGIMGEIGYKKENEFSRNIIRIQECARKIVKKLRRTKDISIEVKKGTSDGADVYQVDIIIGDTPPFTIRHRNADIIMLVLNHGMRDILEKIAKK